MFDNVFFSAKSKRDNEVQPSINYRDNIAQFSEPSIKEKVIDEDTSDGEKERRKIEKKKLKEKERLSKLKQK